MGRGMYGNVLKWVSVETAKKSLHLVHENPPQQLLVPVCTPTLNCQAALHLFTLHVLPVYWANKLQAVISTHQNPTWFPGLAVTSLFPGAPLMENVLFSEQRHLLCAHLIRCQLFTPLVVISLNSLTQPNASSSRLGEGLPEEWLIPADWGGAKPMADFLSEVWGPWVSYQIGDHIPMLGSFKENS